MISGGGEISKEPGRSKKVKFLTLCGQLAVPKFCLLTPYTMDELLAPLKRPLEELREQAGILHTGLEALSATLGDTMAKEGRGGPMSVV
jgi:hypothetical protein